MSTFEKLLLGGLALLAVSLAPARAEASPDYPVALASDLSVATVPVCTICHQSLAGGTGTATKPFATYMQSRGLVAENTQSLQNAVSALTAEAAAGVAAPKQYLAALEAGEDPNDPSAAAGSEPPPPHYGCGAASIAPLQRTESGGALLTLAAFAAAALFRSARRRRPS